MRFNPRTEVPQWVLIGAMFVSAMVFWDTAPDRIPVHWGLSGEPDRYGGKFEGLLGIPLIALASYLLLIFLPRVDPRRANYAQFEGTYAVIRVTIVVFFASLYGFVLLWIQGIEAGVADLVPVLIGALFVVLGNLLGKVRPNWFVGIRTPWTLSSKRSWVKTHRLGGWLFVFMGTALIVAGIWSSATALTLTGALIAACVVFLVAYSYLVWREDPEARPSGWTRADADE